MNGKTLPIAFPYAVDGRGRTADTDPETHLRDLIESVLFTAPGERVMRPTFGSGVLRLVFAPNSDQLAATLKVIVTSALNQTLGDLIQVHEVDIENHDATLSIQVKYLVRSTNESSDATFEGTL